MFFCKKITVDMLFLSKKCIVVFFASLAFKMMVLCNLLNVR